ncbi:hypothetical protein SUGI_0453520 [Cryptomeria japonica]|uniref:uncharacterized protein LOC131033688 n=1 Tax=Cryptomeria japonica TaxID=3369 RepID=UPI002408A724|nr:uncharacterized protein LOC131033688 [Cryptomeria japonica]GLJ23867.1 hypothetical protein SUGI_0453520 [Cryptomeria japonica]
MFKKSFKSAKCKTLVRLAMSRIKLLRNKRDMQLQQLKRDLALLLQSGQDPSARIRVEHVIREQNIMAAYDIIELFCELIVARLSIIESQSKCPLDLREALSSLIFAAPRCADIPELLEIRDLFGMKYGKEFVAAAAELRPDCAVNRTIIEKLSVKAPSGQVKLKLMKEIAKEYHVDWDPAESEEEFLKRPEDLLDGPSKFIAATNLSTVSKKDHWPTTSGQKFESKSPDLHQSPQRNMSRTSTGSSGMCNEDAVLHADKDYNINFKDTASAAKAAADSAEIAVAAARAAAKLAKQGNLQNHCQEAPGPFDPSLSDDETDVAGNLRMNRKQYLHQAQSFHGYDHNRRARVEGQVGNKNLSRSVSGQISRESEVQDSDDDYEMPVKRSSKQDATHHGNEVKYHHNNTQAMQNYDNIRSERHSFGRYRDDPLGDSNIPSLAPRKTQMVYSNNLASPVFDESDCTDSENDEDSDTEQFVSENRSNPQSELRLASQPPTRPPPGVTSSTFNNSQSSPYVGLNSRASHVHPKLPDYDALASRFESLKYQRK